MEFRGSRNEIVDSCFSYYKEKWDTSMLKASDFSNNILPLKYYNDMINGKVQSVVTGQYIKEKVTATFLPYGKLNAARNDEKFLEAILKPQFRQFTSIKHVWSACKNKLMSIPFVCFFHVFICFFHVFICFFHVFICLFYVWFVGTKN